MKVTVDYQYNQVIVEREPSDQKFRNGGYAGNDAGESQLLHHVKLVLIKQGYDVIKKRMGKDGHLVDEGKQYIRTRKPSGNPDKDIYVYNSNYTIRGAEVDFNEDGKVTLTLMTNVFKKELVTT